VLFEGTIFEMNRIVLVRLLAVGSAGPGFLAGNPKDAGCSGPIPGCCGDGLNLVRVNIAEDLLGEKDGKRFLPLLTSIFFLVLFMNLTGVIPGLNIAGTSVIGMPLVLAVTSYLAFIYAGFRKHPVPS
jgi:F-type H+-transporting ATPase subunit a